MKLQEWIEISIKVLSKSSAEEIFLPVVADPATRNVRVLEHIPEDVSQADALQNWIERLAIAECFFGVATNRDVVVEGLRTERIDLALRQSRSRLRSSSEGLARSMGMA
jgi:hypothetical protein